MAKSIKLKNNTYIDSTGIIHEKELLSTIINNSAIYDSGTNSNGSYIRYKNGIMICWRQETVTDQAINNSYGSIFQGARNYTYPIPFSSQPSVTCTSFQHGTGASWGTVVNTSTTTVVLRGFDLFSRGTGEKCIIGYIAIGKWK